jgi:hypothetical protein
MAIKPAKEKMITAKAGAASSIEAAKKGRAQTQQERGCGRGR